MRNNSSNPSVRNRPPARRLDRLAALLRTANTLLGQAGPAKALLVGQAEQWHADYQEYLAASGTAEPLRAFNHPLSGQLNPRPPVTLKRRQRRLSPSTSGRKST